MVKKFPPLRGGNEREGGLMLYTKFKEEPCFYRTD
jgi:hypothetical protein